MKKLNILFLAVGLTLAAASCRNHSPHITIETADNGQFKRVEYTGQVVFSEDKSTISYMSPGAYFNFKTNNDKLTAEADNQGHITYNFNGAKMTALNAEAKQLMEAAVVEIEKTKRRKG